ncbi:ninein isoform X3 [Anguilla anguilla]|uniref:ninein isoform X3 n=1 Tax=Anguilla anguilla TaxID=7936 RepID=UPI0015A7BF5D|nr:ninein isoform X3 [Anguilla anguilla]
MDEAQQDQYELQLREVFQSFDATGRGSLCRQELSDLCQTLHLEEATPTLLHTLLQDRDSANGRVDFQQFKDALILVLSSGAGEPVTGQDTTSPPDSPEARPKFVKDGKRYGRRSVPESRDSVTGFSEVPDSDPAGQDHEEAENPTVPPRKRERWNTHADGTEEYEAEGQLHFWNPDEPGTPRGAAMPLSERLEERLYGACEDLALSWDGLASRSELLSVCEHLGLEVTEEALGNLGSDGVMSVQDFVSWVLEHCKPPTPSASTPYRQLKRHHSTQPFDEMGRRIATPSAMTGTIGLRLFSSLDDGSGFAPVENLLDAWLDEGIENSPEILQALDFSLDGKVNLGDLTIALENELLITKNGIHQAALASFKAEIRHLLECVDRELREKEKIRSDFEKTEKLKNQMATEVDEHHSAIERMNDLNLRKLEQEHREKLAVVRTELTKEMDLIQQQASQQREEQEREMERLKEDEAFLRDHLSLTIKENGRLELELLEGTEKLVEAENTINKLQRNLDNILKEKFGDLDPGSAEFFLQEERLRQLRSHYEGQCREMQDRIDELQAELEEYQTLGRTPNASLKPSLSEEFDSKSPGIESDQGLGSEDCQPFNMTLEAEMLMEQLKAQHLQQVENLRAQMETKVCEYQQKVEEQRAAHEEEQRVLSLQCQGEVQALQEEMSRVQDRVQELQNQLDQVQLERVRLEQSQAEERAELGRRHQEEMNSLRQELLEAQAQITKLGDQLKTLEAHQATCEQSLTEEWEVLRRLHDEQLTQQEEHHRAVLHARLEEERERMLADREEAVRRLVEQWEREKDQLQESHEALLQARLEEERQRYLGESEDQERRLMEQWEKERLELKEQQDGAFQVMLEEERLRLLKDQEQLERSLLEKWEKERAQLEESQERFFQTRLAEERVRIQDEVEKSFMDIWQNEKAQIEEHHEEVLQGRVEEERDRLLGEREVQEKRLLEQVEEERARLEESHREAMQELSARHSEERERLSGALDRLREEIALERSEAGRLAEENVILRQSISALKEEDLRNTQEEMLRKLEHYKKEKLTAQRVAENLKKQVAELRVQGQQLEQENELLSQKNTKNAADVQELNHRLSDMLRQRERKEAGRCPNQQGEPERDDLTTESAQERRKMEACVFTLETKLSKAQEGNSLLEQEKVQLTQELSSLREQLCGGRDLTVDLASAMSRVDKLQKENETLSGELSRCVDKMAKLGTVECQLSHLLEERLSLEKQSQALRAQLTAAQEKVQAKEEALQTVNSQNARLKSDLRVTQQEKEALKQEVMSLHKQLQNANDKNQVLEMALHTSGYQTQHKKLYWDELARLVEQEQQLLRQENERLQREVQNTKGDLVHARDKTRQLETVVLSLKQQKQQGQSSLVKAVEQEKAGLKRELDSLRKELVSANRKVSEHGEVQRELENLRQENEGLKSRQTHLEAQLLEALQAQLGGMVPQAQLRLPGERRGQHRGDELGGRGLELNLQEEQEVKLIKMEERMQEVELKLRNVKMLLQEKVSQLKDQLHKNTKADMMIKDLYVENAQLLKALEMTEQRQKVAEKKNYLLEEKISSLNKIVRDLSPSPLTAMPYHFSRS